MLRAKVIFVCLLWTVSVLSAASQSVPCGIPKPKVNRLIVNGQTADPDDWPWHAAIFHRSAANIPVYACGGTLIHQDYVLTAKHCILNEGTGYPLSSRSILVQLGVAQLYEWNPNFQQHLVRRIHTIEGDEWSDLRNDIAILALLTSVIFNDHVLPVCLEDRQVVAGQRGTVIGFGLTENNTISTVLKMTEMPVIETGKCLRTDRAGWGGMLDESLFCAGFLNRTTVCNGDSGGGYHLKVGSAWQLVGIVSFSLERKPGDNRCRQDAYGAFTSVRKYLPWIRRVTGLSGDQPNETHLPEICGLRTTASKYPWVVPMYHKDIDSSLDRWLNSIVVEVINKRYAISFQMLMRFFTYYANTKVRVLLKGDSLFLYALSDFTNLPYRNVLMNESMMHPKNSPDSDKYSIALLRFDRDILFDDFVQPICLPVAANLRIPQSDELTLVYTTPVNFNQIMSSMPGSRVPFDQCAKEFNRTDDDQGVCIQAYDDLNSCMKDHRGAVTLGRNGRSLVLVGHLISHNLDHNCGTGLRVYSDDRQYVDWIVESLKP